jgi:hypothetical protein
MLRTIVQARGDHGPEIISVQSLQRQPDLLPLDEWKSRFCFRADVSKALQAPLSAVVDHQSQWGE